MAETASKQVLEAAIDGDDRSFLECLPSAALDTYIEMLSERTVARLMKPVGDTTKQNSIEAMHLRKST
jgi:hypothetical protein